MRAETGRGRSAEALRGAGAFSPPSGSRENMFELFLTNTADLSYNSAMEEIPGKKSVSIELKKLFDADQADRMAMEGKWSNPDLVRNVIENDASRLKRANEIYEKYRSDNVALSDEEMIQLAFLFQHSLEIDDYQKAVELGNAAGQEGKWIAAAAEDRWLISKGEKQKWGTQFTHGVEQAPMQSDEESGITDEMRRERGIPPRAEQLSVYLGHLNSRE